MKAVCDFCLAKNANFSKRRNQDLPLNTIYVVGKERFCSLHRSCFFSTKWSRWIIVEDLVLSFGRNLQFFTCQKFVMFSDRHQLSESWLQWFDPIKNYVSRAVENFCPRASTTFIPQDSTWFRESRLLNFQLEARADALMLAEQCWEKNLAQFLSSNWLTLWGYSKRVWHMHLIINLITSDRCFQLCLVASFFPQSRKCEYAKNCTETPVILRSLDHLD